MSITCYDSDGNVLKSLYQWDNNQTLTVQGLDMPPIPVFHFCNRLSKLALVVNPTVSGNAVTVNIPNILLQMAEPIIAYVYQDTENDGYRTMHAIHIPVIPRPKPDDYEYEENIDYISVAILNSRVSSLIQQITGDSTGDPTAEVVDIRIGYDGNIYGSAGDAVRAIGYALNDLHEELVAYVDENAVSNLGLLYNEAESMLYLTNNDEILSDGVRIVSGSGGGGSGNNAVLTVTNTSGWLAKTVSYGSSCPVSLSWSSLENEIETGDGTLTIRVGGTVKKTVGISQGEVTIDVGDYLIAGSNKVRLTVTDVYDNTRSLTYTITAVALSISSTFDTSSAFVAGESISYPYTPTGAVEKTVHFIVDGNSVGTDTVTSSGRQQTHILSGLSHGAHSLRVYFTASINDESVTSNELYYELVVVDSSSVAPIVASPFVMSSSTQYTTLTIPYTVYTPNSLTSDVTLYANNQVVATLSVDRTEQTWSYRADAVGTLTLSIVSGTAIRTFTLDISASEIDVEAETDSLVLYLSTSGRSNNESDPSVWVDDENDISCSLTGFNFTSDGWINDSDGATVLRVSGDARVSIPYKMFASDFRTTGKTIEIEFATRNILNYDAVIMSCMNGGRGFQLTAQKAVLASEQSEISTQYKEDEHVRVSFVVEKRNENRLMYIYINGIMSGVVQYPTDDNFAQVSPVNISIGSNDCTTDVYCIRVYDNDLTRYQILDNWIADTQSIEQMLARYEHNNVYDEYGYVAIDKLPNDLPYMVITCPELPQYKGDKKTVSGYFVDPTDASKSFSFTGAQADVQGTSSQYYPRKNYKIKFKNGFTMTSTGTNVSKFAMRGTSESVPTNAFTFKADVASSEGANNVELARLYNDACPYKTPPQEEDARVRQGIDGFPIVIFWNDGSDVSFVGKYNFNNDKGTEEVFGFEGGDESWEIKNNTGNRVLWKTADYSGTDWLNDFEGRFPEDNDDATNLSALAAWLVTTDQAAATGDSLPASYTDVDGNVHTKDTAAYRLAKFKTEAPNHFEMQSAFFYYLFTELFLMVDSRAKNAFPSFLGGDKWCWLPYDFDTAIGINNEGALVFDYSLEDTDTTAGGADIFNGQQSVMWINLREAFSNEIKAMYQNLRSTGALSYPLVENMFEAHQSKWPVAVFNEDAWFKYIDPLVEDGTNYLDMAQGSKAEQRKWWLYNRFRYIDSKYNAGDALTDVITLRGYARGDITVTPYADIYPSIKYGSYLVSERGHRGTSTLLPMPESLTTLNDTEIYIYSASQLSSIGDISGLQVGMCDLSNATKLQALKVGDSSNSFVNNNMYALTLGNNTLLRSIDARNCAGLGNTALEGHTQTAVDISGCTNIEHVYFDGTNIKSLTLPVGGILKTLQLPSTITNLTIRNQHSISTFYMPSYSNITTLRIENSAGIPLENVLVGASSLTRVRLVGVEWTSASEANLQATITRLRNCGGMDESGNNTPTAVVSGRVNVQSISSELLTEINTYFPDLIVVVSGVAQYLVRFMNTNNTLVYALVVPEGGDAIDPVAAGLCDAPTIAGTDDTYYTFSSWEYLPTNVTSNMTVYARYEEVYRVRYLNWDNSVLSTLYVRSGQNAAYAGSEPTRAATAQYKYDFAGWSGEQTNITSSRDIIATFTATLQKYTVRFMNGTTELQIVSNVEYGSSATYTGTTPTHSNPDYVFTGFSPDGTNITGNTDCYAVFIDMSVPLVKYLNRSMTDYESDTATVIAANAFYQATNLATSTTSANTIGDSAFFGCTALTKVDMTGVSAAQIAANAFSGCTKLTHLIIRSNSVGTLSATSAFTGTKIAAGEGAIYVPSALVDTYKAATNWSTYANQIYPITAYPVTDFSTISDSWDEIFAAESDGTYATKYSVGDTKQIDVNGTQVYMQIAAIDGDALADNSGNAKISWVVKSILTTHNMNSSNTTTGGWSATAMRTYLRDTILPTLPANVRAAIKEVTKTYKDYASSSTLSETDTIWIPSGREVFGGTSYEDSGVIYSGLFNSAATRIKYNAAGTAADWWLRSAISGSDFYSVTNNNSNTNGASNSNGVVFGFCT